MKTTRRSPSLLLLAFPMALALSSTAAADDKETWNVDAPAGPRQEIPIDVDEGTWLSLDVSPEGDEIVFDLLGDIYAVPIAGGDARALTSGFAWDMQPRYSPDGKRIAFTSDRGGGDNVWVMGRDGSEPRAVSAEGFRLLNNPVWSPDGGSIAARKHFTSTRSLGAGEIWLYHASGGEGLQMVAKRNDQKDLGEPAFSPDGRYLYYSLDDTPGATFEYNKDPNAGIYSIRRLDRDTGEDEAVAGGPGGAIRPTPSPDGKRLAFIRRVRYESVIHVRELDSGAERPVAGGLDRDLQETWAIHGVYPNMAWTPDGASIVYWAGGKIRRVDVASGAVAEIPFRVRGAREVVEALRYPVDVAPEEFTPRMLRWVEVAPAGDRVVYQALGRIWIRDLPDGTPRRLTEQTDHLEHFPSFSRDGQWIVYVSWSDDALAAVRVAPAGGGEGRVVTEEKGHYADPVATPDGAAIVYRKVSGGGVVSPLWSREPGIYRVPFEGGAATRIRRGGLAPQFGAASDRVFLLDFAGEGRRELVSIGLDGKEERSHLLSDNATEIRVSPDGKWIAFAERFHCFIAPFPRTGQRVAIGPSTRAIPVRRVSREAGEYLRWSGASDRLYWSLGPRLYERNLTDAFAFLEGSPETLPEPVPVDDGRDISFAARAAAPQRVLALVGGRVVTMSAEEGRGDEVIPNAVIIVRGNRIEAIGPAAAVDIPADAWQLDVRGLTLLPGLIDVHAHGPEGANEIIPQQNPLHLSWLAFGVTTIHDPSNDTSQIFAASEMSRAGIITAPRIYSTGTILYGAAGAFKAEIETLDDAREHLRRMKAVGAISVKSYNQPRRDQRQKVLAAARELEMMVVPEGGSLFEHNMSMVFDGHTGIEHSIPLSKVYADVLQLWPRTGVAYTPTLVVGYGGRWGEDYWYQKTEVWRNERLLRFTPREVIDARSRRRTMIPDEEFNHIDNARIAKRLVDAGGRVQIGGHGQREGLAPHWEIWCLVQGGMTPHQALRAATLDGARYLGLDGDIGSLAPGKLADIIAIEGDPLADIRDSERVRYTIANGRVFYAPEMEELGPGAAKRPPLWFETAPGEPRGWGETEAVDRD